MLAERDFQELLAYKPHHPVLSVYLNTDPSLGNADSYKLRLRSMLKENDLPEDVEAVLGFINREYDWSGRSVVMFSCQTEGYFKAFSLALPIQDRVRIASQPHVKPLANLLDVYGGYGVVLVDRQGARLFYFHLGELREQEGITGEEVRKTKRGGASQMPGRRGGRAGQTEYVEEVADRNMKDVAEIAAHFFGENHIRRVLLAGTEENLAQFRTLLPKTWQSLIVGNFAISMTAKEQDVLEKAMEIVRKEDRKREHQLIQRVMTAAGKGREGVLGLERVLGALHDGRLQVLLVSEGFRSPGYTCESCGFLTSKKIARCPYCGGKIATIPDAVELAVRQSLQNDLEVEFVQGEPGMAEIGHIAALLRY